MNPKKQVDRISELIDDKEKMLAAINNAVQETLLNHKLLGNPIVIWENGKIVWIPPEKIQIKKR